MKIKHLERKWFIEDLKKTGGEMLDVFKKAYTILAVTFLTIVLLTSLL